MHAQNVDFVLLVDCSESMRPCFGQLRDHLNDLLYPLQHASFRVRFGFIGYYAALGLRGPVYSHTFIGGSGPDMMSKLYGTPVNAADFFTTDPSAVARVLGGLEAQGNEDTLMAIDTAADFPFGPTESTRRVIAVFTDEPLEAGVSELAPIAKLPALVQKLMARRIQLFVAAPYSDALGDLGAVDRAEIEAVDGGDGLKSVDFRKLLAQMAKSISVSTMQAGREPTWQRAIYGQDRFTAHPYIQSTDTQPDDLIRLTALSGGRNRNILPRTISE